MDEQLKAKLISYLDKLESTAGKVGDLAATEIPEVIREYLTWLVIERSAYALAFAVPIIVWLMLIKSWRTWIAWADERQKEYREDWYIGIRLLKYSTLVVCLCSLIFGTGTWALAATKVIAAPRVVIVQEIASLTGMKK